MGRVKLRSSVRMKFVVALWLYLGSADLYLCVDRIHVVYCCFCPSTIATKAVNQCTASPQGFIFLTGPQLVCLANSEHKSGPASKSSDAHSKGPCRVRIYFLRI